MGRLKYVKLYEEYLNIDRVNLEVLRENLIDRLREYEYSIVYNISDYTLYKMPIIRELTNEFTDTVVVNIEIDKFLNSLLEPIKDKDIHKIKKLFWDYINYIKIADII